MAFDSCWLFLNIIILLSAGVGQVTQQKLNKAFIVSVMKIHFWPSGFCKLYFSKIIFFLLRNQQSPFKPFELKCGFMWKDISITS